MNPKAYRLKKLRRGLPGEPKVLQSEVCERLDLPRTYMSFYESGRAIIPDDTMAEIERAILEIRAEKAAAREQEREGAVV